MSRVVFGCQACASAFLYFVGELAHGLLRNAAPFTMTKRRVGLIDCCQDFCAGTLAVFPQGKSFPHGIFFPVEPAACDGVADKRLLVRCELYFHHFQNTEKRANPATLKTGHFTPAAVARPGSGLLPGAVGGEENRLSRGQAGGRGADGDLAGPQSRAHCRHGPALV